jgi:predicted metal-dependent hydrolase
MQEKYLMDITYKIRQSSRAKHLQIQASRSKGLEVVIPYGVSSLAVERFINEKKDWIQKTLKRLAKEKPLKVNGDNKPPLCIKLPALGLTYQVKYESNQARSTTARLTSDGAIIVKGNGATSSRRSALKRLIKRLARLELNKSISALGSQHRLTYSKIAIKSQKTVWGSCSSKKIINLNQNLLFLPKHLAQHVLIHELCHTKHLNHSNEYWQLVGSIAPDYKKLEKELKTAWRYVPAWAASK